jgi:hypothetical protein
VNAGLDGDFQLGADAIRGGDEHGIGKPGGFQVEQRAKAAQPADDAGAGRRLGQRLDRLDQRIPRLDINPGIPVCHAGHISPQCAKPCSMALLCPYSVPPFITGGCPVQSPPAKP